MYYVLLLPFLYSKCTVLFTLYVCTGLFLLCGGVFCTAVYCHCLSDPSLLEKVSGGPELGWAIVLLIGPYVEISTPRARAFL